MKIFILEKYLFRIKLNIKHKEGKKKCFLEQEKKMMI